MITTVLVQYEEKLTMTEEWRVESKLLLVVSSKYRERDIQQFNSCTVGTRDYVDLF